jgi:hypothetical protein
MADNLASVDRKSHDSLKKYKGRRGKRGLDGLVVNVSDLVNQGYISPESSLHKR